MNISHLSTGSKDSCDLIGGHCLPATYRVYRLPVNSAITCVLYTVRGTKTHRKPLPSDKRRALRYWHANGVFTVRPLSSTIILVETIHTPLRKQYAHIFDYKGVDWRLLELAVPPI